MSLELIIASGVMAFLSAYMLWKIAESNRYREQTEKSSGGIKTHNALQIIFFFMIIASLIILGRAGLDSGEVCNFLVDNETLAGNVTSYEYAYTCQDLTNNNNIWIYKLPLYLAYLSSFYLLIYLLLFIWELVKSLPFFRGGDRG